MFYDSPITRSPWLHLPQDHGHKFRIEASQFRLRKVDGFHYLRGEYVTCHGTTPGLFFTVPCKGVTFSFFNHDGISLN